jgi:hypothetical protein
MNSGKWDSLQGQALSDILPTNVTKTLDEFRIDREIEMCMRVNMQLEARRQREVAMEQEEAKRQMQLKMQREEESRHRNLMVKKMDEEDKLQRDKRIYKDVEFPEENEDWLYERKQRPRFAPIDHDLAWEARKAREHISRNV